LNDVIKNHFNISMKASSKVEIRARLGQHEITQRVLEIMDSMENGSNQPVKDINYFKDNVKRICKMLQST